MYGALRQGRATGGETAWTKSVENPLLDGSEAFVRLEGALYRMWLSHPDGQCITYAWSNDGLAWNEEPDAMLCAPHDGSWEQDGVWDPSIVVDGGGTYWMFYEGANWGEAQQAKIGCATSPDGLAWTRCAENPVLVPGDPGAWDESWAADPAVLMEGTTFKMWYRGRSAGGTNAIGYATSPDGVTWTKDGANPVLQGTPGTWDENDARGHSVWYDSVSTYHLWYASNGRIGHAASADGIAWTKTTDPVLQPGWYGEWGEPVVRFVGGSQGAVLDGFTVTGGDGQGGIRIEGTEVQVASCTVTGNRSDTHWGGGVNVDGGAQATIAHTAILDNVAGGAGGLGAVNNSTVSLVESEVAGNSTTWGAGGGLGVWFGTTLTSTDSLVHDNSTPSAGGGIEIADGATATFERTDFVENHAGRDGGGLRVVNSSSLTFTDGQVAGNTASDCGGISVQPGVTVLVQGSTLSGNVANSWGGGLGSWGGDVTLTSVTVSGNQALSGETGGLGLWDSTTASLTDVVIENNTAESTGVGGLNVGEMSVVTLENVQIRGNTAHWGTGLRLHRSTVTGNRVWIQNNLSTEQDYAGFTLGSQSTLALTNALITGNDGGAGSVWDGSTLTLTNVTLADNSRGDGWGGLNVGGDAAATVRNSILAYNGQADLSCDDPGTCSVEYSDLEHAWPGTGNLSTNPGFVDRAGGDYHLAGGSPCIEAADPAYAPGNDIDGEARPYDGDGDGTALPDMGADEYTGDPTPIEPLTDLYVDGTAAPGGNGTPEDPFATVGEALAAAWPGDTIHVADGTYLENVEIAENLTVLGGYSGVPDWIRDPAEYVTVLDGSANPTIAGDWDGQGFGMPDVVWDPNASEYKMYYNGSGLDGRWAIGLATSPDGLTWTKYPGNPIMAGDNQTWEGDSVLEPFVRVEGPGNYKMWYGNDTSVGYATSTDGLTWTKQAGPIFEPNPNPGAWDSWSVRAPSVVKPGAVYVMYYTGSDGSGVWWMGFATSSNGINWTRHGDPVLAPGDPGEWDDLRVYRPDVTYAGGQYHAFYVGISQLGLWNLGVATSPNGIAWTKHAGNPVLPGTEPWENQSAWGAGHFRDGATWKVWYVGIGDGGTGFGLATSGDGLAWTPDDAHNPLLEPGAPGQNGAPAVNIHTPAQGLLAKLPAWLARLEAAPSAKVDQAQVLLDGLTVTGGTYWNGGGVHIENADATLQDMRVTGNQALGNGGGIGAYSGSVVQILASEILSNTAQEWGGGLHGSGGSHVTMENVNVQGNHAITQEGGGLLFTETGTEAHLTDVAVVENQADGGGGISLTSGPDVLLVMDRVEIARNVARWAAGMRPYMCNIVGDRVWIVDNVATDEGCGGFNADGESQVTLTNSLIAGNAGNAGCIQGGSLSLTNVTVADNTHSSGWGGLGVGGTGVATVRNSILYSNGDGDLSCDAEATCTVEYSDLEHAWAGTGNISSDPLFADQANGDYHLLEGSPCIDAASPDYMPDHDIDGEPRPVDGDGDGSALPDMGADELFGPHTVHLSSWVMFSRLARPGAYLVIAQGVVHDQDHNPLAGVTVTGNWTLPNGTVVAATSTVTGANGAWKIQTIRPQVGLYQFDITGMSGAGYLYNPTDNHVSTHKEKTVP